jgi:tetratricopeptide (TPR) repeat protein
MNEDLKAALDTSSTYLSVCKKVLPFLDDPDPSTRADAAVGIETVLSHHPGGGDLRSAIQVSTPPLLARFEDSSQDVRTVARSTAGMLARQARKAGYYAAALTILDALLSCSVEPVLWIERWECRLALGRDEEAAQDLLAFRAATEGWDDETLAAILAQPERDPRGLDAWRAQALTRVASSDLANTERARSLLEQSRMLDQGRVDSLLEEMAKGAPSPVWRYLPAETYALLALLAERSGDIPGAIASLKVAATISPTGGLGAHIHSERYSVWLHRLSTVDNCLAGAPPDFDRSWFMDLARTPEELQAAMSSWAQTDWRRFPTTVDEALGTPLLALLMTDLERLRMGSAAYASAATAADCALYTQHLPLFQEQFGHRFETWKSALSSSNGALTVVFDPLSRRPGDPEAKAAAFTAWLEATRRATGARNPGSATRPSLRQPRHPAGSPRSLPRRDPISC